MDRRSTTIIACLGVPTLTIGTDFTGALMLVIPIEREFSADITTTQWVLNVYALTMAMGMVTGGRLADMFGHRRMLLIGLAVFVAASLGCAAAPSIGWLIAARAVQGIGTALVWPSILASASRTVRPDELGFAISLIIGIVTAGNVIGPVIAGIVGGLGEWRLFYVVNLVLGLLSAILIARVLPADSEKREDEAIDYRGNIVLALAILALLYALDVGAEWGWLTFAVIGLFAAALVLFALFPAIEKRVADPLVPLPMLHNRQFLMALSLNALVIPAVFLLYLYIPQYLHKVFGWSVLMSAIGTLPLTICLSSLSIIAGHLYNRVGPRRLLFIGYSLASLGCATVPLISADWGYPGLLPAMLLIGIGSALSVGPAGSAAVGAADPKRAGLAGGLSFMAHLALGAIGVAAGTAILAALSGAHLKQGLAALNVKMSAADQLALNGGAAGTEESRDILSKYSATDGERIVQLVQDGFANGFHTAYWLALALCLIGVGIALALDEAKLTQRDEG